jgi:hypothetical protein
VPPPSRPTLPEHAMTPRKPWGSCSKGSSRYDLLDPTTNDHDLTAGVSHCCMIRHAVTCYRLR